MKFKGRLEAGRKLALRLKKYKNNKDVIVLGIPRGGVEVAFKVAKILQTKLSIVVTKKIGHPFQSEFAIGAVSLGNFIVDEGYGKEANEDYIKKTVRKMNKEIKRRYKIYTNGKMTKLKDKIVIIVDDGLATGYTMLAAVKYVKSKNPKKVVVAIPIAAQDSLEKVKKVVDEVVCLHVPVLFGAVGSFYEDFMQLEDEEVKSYLEDWR